MSENISVVSVVGRFLEHSRIYGFHRGDERRYWIGSGDLMPRNLDTRVELLAPVEDPELRDELEDTLERCLADDTFGWELRADETWKRRTGRKRAAHRELMERAGERAAAAAAGATVETPRGGRAPSRRGSGRRPELPLQLEHARGRARTCAAKGGRAARAREQPREDLVPAARPGQQHQVDPGGHRALAGLGHPGAGQHGLGLDAVGDRHAAEAELARAAGRP